MSNKPASMYREITNPTYTRREYITGIPGSRIAQHNMGGLQADPEDYPVQISLKVEGEVQIRHGSLESTRLSANRLMLRHAGEEQHKMILRKFPHYVIRESKQATGAGADRISDGMRQSFGKVVGAAARTPKGETVFTIYCDVEDARTTRDTFRRAYNKMSPPCRVVVDHGGELLVA